MSNKPFALWEQALLYIKENVTEQQFKTWFKPIVFESYQNETKTLLVQVPSPFVYEYLEENYVDLLSKVLTRVFGAGIKLTYRVVTDKIHQLTQDLQAETVENQIEQQPTNRANQSPTILDTVKQQEIDSQLDPHKSFSSFI